MIELPEEASTQSPVCNGKHALQVVGACALIYLLVFGIPSPTTVSTFNPRAYVGLNQTPAISLSSMPCPRVFIYSGLAETAGYRGSVPTADISTSLAFGRSLQPCVHATSALSLAHIMLYRIHHSVHCPVTKNPEEADLFIIPTLSSVRGGRDEWDPLCTEKNLWGKNRVNGADGYTLKFLPHLNDQTAKKHLFFISKSHYVVAKGDSCAWIRGEYPADPVFADIQRFAFTHTYAGTQYETNNWGLPSVPVLDDRVISVPFPSSVHWSAAGCSNGRAPWQRFSDRPIRIQYIGQAHGLQASLREQLLISCKSLKKPRCSALTEFEHEIVVVKQRAIFCLEPEGDNPFRKSIFDSITSGCIPVFFSHDTDSTSAWHWGTFRNESRVLLSASEFMSATARGEHGLQALLDMPESRIRAMQASIAKDAHRLQVRSRINNRHQEGR